MSTLIKSGELSNNSISGYHDKFSDFDYDVMLDFERGVYTYNDDGTHKELTLEEVLATTRAGSASYITNLGEVKEVAENEPRLSYDKNIGVRGLLTEEARTNLLTNPSTPQTQTLTIEGMTATSALVLSVYGSGEASISGQIESMSGTTATENNPVAVICSTTGSVLVTITVTGNLTKFQLEKVDNGHNVPTSFMQNSRAKETIYLSPFLAAKLANTQTIVCIAHINRELIYTAGGTKFLYTMLGANNTDKITLEYQKRSEGGAHIKLSAKAGLVGGVGNRFDDGLQLGVESAVYGGIAYDKGGLNLTTAANGYSQKLEGEGVFVDYVNLVFGTRTTTFNSLITKFIMFDRRLSDAELAKITRL